MHLHNTTTITPTSTAAAMGEMVQSLIQKRFHSEVAEMGNNNNNKHSHVNQHSELENGLNSDDDDDEKKSSLFERTMDITSSSSSLEDKSNTVMSQFLKDRFQYYETEFSRALQRLDSCGRSPGGEREREIHVHMIYSLVNLC